MGELIKKVDIHTLTDPVQA